MPRGYPDYFGQSVFAGPGNQTIRATGAAAVAAGVETDIITVVGRGSLFGGWIEGLTTDDAADQWIKVYIEGNLLEFNSIGNMLMYDENHDSGLLIGLQAFIPELVRWEARFTEDFVFGTALRIAFWNNTAGVINISSNIWYYLIT